MIEAIAAGTRMRRKGRIVSRDRAEVGSCDLGEGEKPTVQVGWGDVATAFHSTGIPNIDVHFEASPAIRAIARTPWFVKSFLGLDPIQSILKSQVDRLPEGPRIGRPSSLRPRVELHKGTAAIAASLRVSRSARMHVNLRDVSLEQPSRPTAGQGGWVWAKLMDYNVIIITEADPSDDSAFVYPFKANKTEDFEVGVREAIAEWRRYNPNQDFLEAGCTLLVEKAVFSCSAQAVADDVS